MKVDAQMRSTFVLVLALGCFGIHGAHAADSCLQYSPTRVTLSGKLERLTFPGRPNFESVASGDEAETGFYLALNKEVCVDGGKESSKESPDAYPQDGVKLVQLVLDNEGYARLRPLVGKDITLSGTLFARFTGHHHAPLLLQNVTNSSRRAQ